MTYRHFVSSYRLVSHFSTLLLVVLLIVGCSGSKEDPTALASKSPEVMYNEALAALEARDYKQAVPLFEDLEREHPYSEWATRGQVMAAYALYRNSKYDDAVSTLERFAKEHPGNSNMAYALYLRALCYYEQITDVGRDQKMTGMAQQALREVMERFPDSEYARDARIKLDLTMDHLAGKEMEVGRYYLRHLEYLSAINRFRTVVEKYETTTHAPEALHRLVECYLKLGITDQAQRYGAVLGHNYPGSSWYKDSYALLHGKPLPDHEEDSHGLLKRLIKF